MKPDSFIKIIVAVLAIVLIAIIVHSCRDACHASPVVQTTGTQTTTVTKPGVPDTVINRKPVQGKATLKPSHFAPRTSDTTKPVWSGSIHIGKDSISVTAKEDTAGTLNLEYTGSFAETVISKVDSVFSNTVVTQLEKTPWYETPIAVITGTIAIIIGIIFLVK